MSLSLTGENKSPTKAALVESSASPGGAQLINAYRTTKHAPSDLVALAQEIDKADCFTRANVNNKLQVIAEQVRFLQAQAKKILEEAHSNNDLHRVACNLVKQPGTIYYLYRRPSGQRYFSIMSPQEWGESPHEYLGAWRLEADQSWTPLSQLNARDSDRHLIDTILSSSSVAAITNS